MKAHSFFALLVGASLALSGCSSTANPGVNPDPAHNARNALDWAGTYRGVLPCADCEGIETVVVLSADGTFSTRSRYLGKGNEIFREEGRFTWNKPGNTITLGQSEPEQYFVAENRLIRLARDGSRVTGPLADYYVLSKDTEARSN